MKTRLFLKLENIEIDGIKVPIPQPLPWYPDELGWLYECGRNALRNSESVNLFA
jgi:hypothetical protein